MNVEELVLDSNEAVVSKHGTGNARNYLSTGNLSTLSHHVALANG